MIASVAMAGCSVKNMRQITSQQTVAALQVAGLRARGAHVRAGTVDALMLGQPAETTGGTETCSLADADKYKIETMSLCTRSFEKSQQEFRLSQGWVLFLTLIGAGSGAVGVPALTAAAAANKVWISAFGGVAGMTNALAASTAAAGEAPKNFSQDRSNFLDRARADLNDIAAKRKQLDCEGTMAAIDMLNFDCQDYLNGIPSGTADVPAVPTPARAPSPAPTP